MELESKVKERADKMLEEATAEFDGTYKTYRSKFALELPIKMNRYPIGKDEENETILYSQEQTLKIDNYRDCTMDDIGEDRTPDNKPMRRIKFCFISNEICPVKLDKEIETIAKYLINNVCPRVFNRTKQASEVHHVTAYRLNVFLHNLIINWMFLMFEPHKAKVSFFDLMKSQGEAVSSFFLPCGNMFLLSTNLHYTHLNRLKLERTRHDERID